MQKKLTILILIMFNLNFYTQVVIKDEIDLDAEKFEIQQTESAGLTMPFYGKITGNAPWGTYYNNNLKRVVIEAGGQTVTRGYTICNGGGYFNGSWAILNVTASTPVNVTVYSHCQGGQQIEAQTQLITIDSLNYEVSAYNPSRQQWFVATTIKFTATTPPSCINANNNYCNSTTFHTPSVNLFLEEEGYADPLEPCTTQVARTMGKYIPEHQNRYSNSNLFNENSLEACFNKNTQKWQFNFISPADFEIHFMLDYCEDNLDQYIVLENINDVDEIFDCYFAELCFNKHRYQLGWSGVLYPGCYLIKEVVTLHEQLHFTHRINDLVELREKYNMNIELWQKNYSSCNSFLNPTVAKQEALKFVKNQFTKIKNEIALRIKQNKAEEEKNVRSSILIDEIVDDYLNALYNHCYN